MATGSAVRPSVRYATAVLSRLLQLGGLLSPDVTAEAALDAARRTCAERGLAWEEPVKVKLTPKGYRIWTKADSIGGNTVIWVDHQNAQVKEVVTTPK